MLFYNDIFFKTLGLRLLVVRLHYVWKKRYKWSCFCSSLWRIFITSQLDYLFVRCSYIFYDIRITLCFGTFELLMEITLQSRFVFVHHCDVFFITSQLRYLFLWFSYVFWWRKSYVLFCYIRNTYGNNATITFRFCSSLWHNFYYVTFTLFICSM